MAESVSRSRAHLARAAMTFLFILTVTITIPQQASAQAGDPGPPAQPVKLIFIHHSCGENWLADDDGGLGRALDANNYFVSDTNYGWGPDSIGDRTDITDWPKWFTGPDSDRYMAALYAESGQSSPYTRTLRDPGAENQIVMFKSCFPNSNLEGNPGDPPRRGEGLTVGNAKAIYNELLTYFATLPDKLFIVVTAPPVQDHTYAANARAFNTWLVQDWLDNYAGTNVAVFDFYNVLTHPNNHHRFHNGAIEYVTDRGGDTLYYPSDGDDHPAPAGNRKATEEFIPLLNVFFHRWQSGAPIAPPPAPLPSHLPTSEDEASMPEPTSSLPGGAETPTSLPQSPVAVGGVIDNFETDADRWTIFADGEKDTRLTCGRDEAVSYSGTAGLRIEYDVAPDSWAECSLVYPSPQDWRGGLGLAVYLRAEQMGQQTVIIVYQGDSPDSLLHFEFRAQVTQEAVDGWQRVDVLWDQFVQPSWQGDSAVPLDPNQTMGIAFLFDAPDGRHDSGKLWVDDVRLLSVAPPAPAPTEYSTDEPEMTSNGGRACPAFLAFGLVILVGVVGARRKALFGRLSKT